jgi:oxygen-independent coproporphyrinogen-3 oxidase
VGRVRYGNARSVERYCDLLERGGLPVTDHEWLTPRQEQGERLMLGLRMCDGVPAEWLQARAAQSRSLAPRLTTWERAGLLVVADGQARLTEAGFLLSDALFVELL